MSITDEQPRPRRIEETLIRLLMGFHGVSTLCALPAVVMPHSWMVAATAWVAPGQSVTPLFSYLARSLSAFYAGIGLLLLVFISDVARYRRALQAACIWMIGFSAFVLYTGLAGLAAFERPWLPLFCIGDGLWNLAAAATVLVCLRRIFSPPSATDPAA